MRIMKEKLTREVVEAMAKCSKTSGDCSRCGAYEFCRENSASFRFEKLATALLEEMDKPKVWDGSPEEAEYITVGFYKHGLPLSPIKVITYDRELPKTSARKTAEELYKILCFQRTGKTDCINAIESALEKYAAELKGEA